jgi:hypothetical protein
VERPLLAFNERSYVLRIKGDAVEQPLIMRSFSGRRDSSSRLPSEMLGWRPDPGRVFSYPLLKRFLAAPDEFAAQIGRIALRPDSLAQLESARASDRPVDFRLEIEPGLRWLSALPWELMIDPINPWRSLASSGLVNCFYRSVRPSTDHEVTLWLQKVLNLVTANSLLVDGVTGPDTRRALMRFQRQAGIQVDGILGADTRSHLSHALRAERRHPLRVLILKSSWARQHRVRRGSEHEGVNLSSLYEAAGLRSAVLEDPRPGTLDARLREAPPHVVHICGCIRENPSSGAVEFDFGEERVNSYATPGIVDCRLTVPMLGRAIQGLSKSAVRPLVILDIDRPPGITEVADQLFLRNAFAADLFALGSTLGVLAIGLTAYEERMRQQNLLAEALERGWAVGEIATSLREQSLVHTYGLEAKLAAAGTVLFASDPALTPI